MSYQEPKRMFQRPALYDKNVQDLITRNRLRKIMLDNSKVRCKRCDSWTECSSWLTKPATWKCKHCGYTFNFEPVE